ncbi:MAG: tetratricopeptide repeat protein [Lachnospiraceae bacterium]|nr:tetratricopeptide repeat protein [Lachnospiraceae bacterium]
MAFDYSDEGNYRTLNKIRNMDPYLGLAVFYLSQFSERVILPDAEDMLEIKGRIIQPRIVFLDDSYPIVQCRKRIFSRQNRIEISYGIFVMLGMMGEFEKTINTMIDDETKNNMISFQDLREMNIDPLVRCVKDALNYLKLSYYAMPDTAPELPKMTLTSYILNDALQFIVGHEISHYVEMYYKYDSRVEQQLDVLNQCMVFLSAVKGTPAKFFVDKFFSYLDTHPGEQLYAIWSEEVLADYEGFHYLCPHAPRGRIGSHKIMAVSLAFLVLKLMEYFESTLPNPPQEFAVPVRWREFFLQFILYQNYYSDYDSFEEFIDNEWGLNRAICYLYERVIITIKAETPPDMEEEENIMETDSEIDRELSCCDELIEKLQSVQASEAENIFQEIKERYEKHGSNKQFKSAFPFDKLTKILDQFGHECYEQTEYDKSYVWFYRATTYFEGSKDALTLPAADSYYWLGNACYQKGQYREATWWYRCAIDIRQEILGFSFEENLEIYLHSARAYMEAENGAEAMETFQKICECTKDDDMKAEAYRSMGIICDRQGDNQRALEFFFQALDIKDSKYGMGNLDSATLYNSIGIIYSNQEKFTEAEKYLMLALQIKRDCMDEKALSLMNTMYSLGMLEARRGCWQKALDWYQIVLDVRMEVLGERHPRVADTLQAIGGAYYVKKDYGEALAYYQQAFVIYKNIYGKKHEQTLKTEQNIAILKKMLSLKYDDKNGNLC